MAFPVIGGTQESGYNIDNSLRFNDDDSAYLDKTFSSSGNRKTLTISCWIKRATLSTFQTIISAGTNGATYSDDISFQTSDKLLVDLISTSGRYQAQTSALFRDVSAWYHVVVKIDTTQASNRMLVYVNNEQVAVNSTGIPQNEDITFGSNTLHNIGRRSVNNGSLADYYMSDFYFIDGQALAPTEFGETDDNGVWIPKNYTGSYGTNGFKLEFKQLGTAADATSIGADTSGNDNHFSQTNVTPAVDRTEDTPTNNFCTFNPIFTGQRGTFSEGNTKLVTNVQGSVNYGQSVIGTFLLTAGKWYWEIEVDAVGSGGNVGIGVNERIDAGIYNNGHNNLGSTGTAFYKSDGNIQINSGSNISNTSYTSGDIISVALDLDNSRIYWAKNGVYQSNGSGTGNPSTGANPVTLTSSYDDGWVVFCSKDDTINNATFIANFGNPSFSISSGNSDANGYGNFEYAPPTNYYSLCSKNLAEYG